MKNCFIGIITPVNGTSIRKLQTGILFSWNAFADSLKAVNRFALSYSNVRNLKQSSALSMIAIFVSIRNA